MLKYITKLAMEIVPSVVATILGAYIVNHYINAKSETPAAAVAAAASTADIKPDTPKIDGVKIDGVKIDGLKADTKPAETPAEVSNIPGAGIKAKGISEKSISDKAAEKPAEVKPTETASLPAESPRHSILTKRATPAAAETAPTVEEHRDAADLARAAIERLRASEGTRTPEHGPGSGYAARRDRFACSSVAGSSASTAGPGLDAARRRHGSGSLGCWRQSALYRFDPGR